jgi:hypothetical protein
MSPSRESSLGVVPDATSAWNPDTAPQAIVMKQKGKTGPAKTGPEPSTNLVTAGIRRCGPRMTIAMPSAKTVPIFMNVLR